MVKQISISDELAIFLDHFREEWGNPGYLSYTKTIERFIKSTDAEEILRREIVELFKNLQFRLPKRFFHNLEVIKASVLSLVGWGEDERNIFCDRLHLLMSEMKGITKNSKKEVGELET